MQAHKYIERHGDNAGAAWLRNRGGDIKTQGVGHTNGLEFDRSKVRTVAKDENTKYLNRRHGKAGR